ncbi:hypothetical protein AB0C34_21930 [Nocardia sp. NPDC049220]|uniref:hypothetical protein n=1 Tax=Nocardia sp. NPDC049220 TaxID=3155273 RepID=UPI0033FA0AA6
MRKALVPPHKTLTRFDGTLVTIRSENSFFDVTMAIESRLQRLSVPRLIEYVTSADREGLEIYVDEVSKPSERGPNFSRTPPPSCVPDVSDGDGRLRPLVPVPRARLL